MSLRETHAETLGGHRRAAVGLRSSLQSPCFTALLRRKEGLLNVTITSDYCSLSHLLQESSTRVQCSYPVNKNTNRILSWKHKTGERRTLLAASPPVTKSYLCTGKTFLEMLLLFQKRNQQTQKWRRGNILGGTF